MAFIKTKPSPVRPDDLLNTLRLRYGFNDQEEQKAQGILAKPAQPASDSEVIAAGFFNDMLTKAQERAAQVRAEAMEQYARESAEEAAKLREIMGISRSKVPQRDMTASEEFDATVPAPESEPLIEADTLKPEQAVKEGLMSVDTSSATQTMKETIEDVLETVIDSDDTVSTDSADGGAATDGKGLMSPVTDDDMGLPDKASQIEELKGLYAKKGKAYKESKIKSYSYVKEPLVEGGVRGNSRIHGDASIETQNIVIDRIVSKGREEGLTDRQIAMVLATAKVESGFNPDAAAGTTSARGIGQFVNDTGASYGITEENQWDLNTQVDALIAHTLDNYKRAKGKDEAYVYAYHHDGPSLKYGGLKISEDKVMPLVDKFEAYLKSKGELQNIDFPEPDRSRTSSPRPRLRD